MARTKHADSALFHIDNALFRIYTVGNREAEAKKLFKKLSKKVKGDISKQDRLGFYYYSWVYYNKLNQAEEADVYKRQYDELKKQ